MLKTIEELFEAYGLILDLYDGDKDKATKWMMESNHIFFDDKPVIMILGGRSKAVMNFLNERIGE